MLNRKFMLSFAALLQVALLAGCGTTNNGTTANNKQTEPQVTTLTYSINLKKGANGKYEGKVGAKIIVTAKAEGPDAKTVTWTATPNPDKGYNSISLTGGVKLGGSENIDQPYNFTFSEAFQGGIKCVPAMRKNENGKELITGEETFHIVVK